MMKTCAHMKKKTQYNLDHIGSLDFYMKKWTKITLIVTCKVKNELFFCSFFGPINCFDYHNFMNY